MRPRIWFESIRRKGNSPNWSFHKQQKQKINWFTRTALFSVQVNHHFPLSKRSQSFPSPSISQMHTKSVCVCVCLSIFPIIILYSKLLWRSKVSLSGFNGAATVSEQKTYWSKLPFRFYINQFNRLPHFFCATMARPAFCSLVQAQSMHSVWPKIIFREGWYDEG